VCEKTLKRVFSHTVPLVRFFHSLSAWECTSRRSASNLALPRRSSSVSLEHLSDRLVIPESKVRTFPLAYKLSNDTLTLTFDGKSTTWNRVKVPAPAKP
jgi:hypothetical protein